MIKELLQYFSSPANETAKTWGYLHQSIALENRYQRCQNQWSTHLKKCHDFFKSEIPLSAKSVTILGSGLLSEVPKDFLIERFEEIHLVDMVHPRAVRKWAEAHRQVRLVEMDVTGVLTQLEYKVPLRKIHFKPIAPWPVADLVVSANLISQLPYIPLRKLLNTSLPEKELIQLGRKMIQNHFFQLSQMPKSIYWSDDVEVIKNRRGEVIAQNQTALDVPFPKIKQSWIWNLSPIGEVSHFKSHELIVKAGVA
ncbi:MAG: hypothetical protein LW875_06700 [Proteobacteria bacterium]|jgi:hypothetical protein|nr:hypothetical protein [Pseudomonadota bacterium]